MGEDENECAATLNNYTTVHVHTTVVMSNVVIKGIRYMIDKQQYGKSYSMINVKFDNDAERNKFINCNMEERVDRYRSILENMGRYAAWPLIQNFEGEWNRHNRTKNLPRKSLWFVRKETMGRKTKRKILFFVHGGATFTGSLHKYNNLHWLKTIDWLGGLENRYSDIVSIDYRFRPEYTINDSIDDCLASITTMLQEYKDNGVPIDTFYLIGFSVGAMLCLQCAMLIDVSLSQLETMTTQRLDETTTNSLNTYHAMSEVKIMNDKNLDRLCNGSTDLRRNIHGKRHIYLLAPLCRLDRLFINEAFDVSSIIKIFSNAFFKQKADQYDQLFTIVQRKLALGPFEHVSLIDVCRNSLSNHAIHLEQILRDRRPNSCKVKLVLLDETDLLVDETLAKIYVYELRIGRTPNKYIRYEQHVSETPNDLGTVEHNSTAEEVLDRKHKLANFVYCHFFMYIVPCNTSWRTLKTIFCDRTEAQVGYVSQRTMGATVRTL